MERYGATVIRLASSSLTNSANAADVMQETLLHITMTRTTTPSQEHERHWVVQVAVNERKKLNR